MKTGGARTFYISDFALWDEAKLKAESENRSLSSVIEEALRNYVNPSTGSEEKIQLIRAILAA